MLELEVRVWFRTCKAHKLFFFNIYFVFSLPESFEVTVDGVLVYSKLQSGTFPDESTVRETSCWHRAPRPAPTENTHLVRVALDIEGLEYNQ